MILDIHYWNKWEEELQRRTPVDVDRNFRMMDAMYQEVRELGMMKRSDPMEGLEPIILYAKAINFLNPSRPNP
jgi:hypothetical protein